MMPANDNQLIRVAALVPPGATGFGPVLLAARGLVGAVAASVAAARGRIIAAGGSAGNGLVRGGDHVQGFSLRVQAASSGKVRSITGRGALFLVASTPAAVRGSRVDVLA